MVKEKQHAQHSALTWLCRLANPAGSLCFLFGSIFFLPVFSAHAEAGVWFFIAGSSVMLLTTSKDLADELLKQ